jgi:hypothetical protein
MQHSSRTTPCRTGRVFSFVIAALCVLAVTPARAANVTVTLQIDLGYAPAAAEYAACTVSVPDQAPGLVVLDAAKAKGCISGYETVVFSGKHYISCIDDICQVADGLATYWRMTVNDAYVCFGADDFRSTNGKKLGFAYVPGASFVLDPAC